MGTTAASNEAASKSAPKGSRSQDLKNIGNFTYFKGRVCGGRGTNTNTLNKGRFRGYVQTPVVLRSLIEFKHQ